MTDKKVWFNTEADSISRAEQRVANRKEQIDAYRDLSPSLTLDDLQPTENRR